MSSHCVRRCPNPPLFVVRAEDQPVTLLGACGTHLVRQVRQAQRGDVNRRVVVVGAS